MGINPGKILIVVSYVLFAVLLLLSLYIGLKMLPANLMYGILVLLIGLIVSVMICLPMYALGYVIIALKDTRDLTEDILICIAEKQ